MAEYVAFAGEIEIGVLSEIQDRVFVGRSGVVESQAVIFRQRVDRRD